VSQPWNDGVRGTQVLPLINHDADVIRVEAGPGTGKTFGLARRVERIVHPNGLAIPGDEVLVVAFNRAIAKDLRAVIETRLAKSGYSGKPVVIRTVHALCLQVLGSPPRLLLPHEREAMIYDVLHDFPQLRETFGNHADADQALRDHEAKHQDHPSLWQAVQRWLTRHKAQLISDLPGLLLDRLKGGDFAGRTYRHVIVDEFQDLTPGEQDLFMKLRAPGGQFVALGDPRQSIYRFRGNDLLGLAKLESFGAPVTDLPMSECQRCPDDIVRAANRLMTLSPAQQMHPARDEAANVHVVYWSSPKQEAIGMARSIVANLRAHPDDKHLVMVSRRQFGYQLREQINEIDASLSVDLNFSESLLETWSVREAFLFFCLAVDPDPPTWRAWLGYQNSASGKDCKAPERNTDAYLRLLTANSDRITESPIRRLVSEPQGQKRGGGGAKLWERAQRFADLKDGLSADGSDAQKALVEILNPEKWVSAETADAETARLDLEFLLAKASADLKEIKLHDADASGSTHLKEVARQLRYQIATREPFDHDEEAALQVATLWGAKGVTADHVYVLGLCEQAVPGSRRDEYPGTDIEYREEQRRLFYVSITRSKKTLVLSRATHIQHGDAKRLGFDVGAGHPAELAMCPFLRDISNYLPNATAGNVWKGC
jgi:DNA helicase-2/ATP-dependent DNA helicase PcrA